MRNNNFQLDDTFWLHKNGTAMGTSSACTVATIYYSHHEEATLMNLEYDYGILFYRRLIDDAFMIIRDNPGNMPHIINKMNDFGTHDGLEWE